MLLFEDDSCVAGSKKCDVDLKVPGRSIDLKLSLSKPWMVPDTQRTCYSAPFMEIAPSNMGSNELISTPLSSLCPSPASTTDLFVPALASFKCLEDYVQQSELLALCRTRALCVNYFTSGSQLERPKS